ncbi:MAG: hypothetical protein II844_06170 [Prevotella sp.]|nr:hypothetical protein [Prevotella sp.]MBR6190706.1 hypothetical protein [Prevotella sp.]
MMNRKDYIIPRVKLVKLRIPRLLAESNVDFGDPNEEAAAKSSFSGFIDDEDDDSGAW